MVVPVPDICLLSLNSKSILSTLPCGVGVGILLSSGFLLGSAGKRHWKEMEGGRSREVVSLLLFRFLSDGSTAALALASSFLQLLSGEA